MMQDEILRIAGKEVDIIPNSIDRTIQINDLGSAESRESSYSQTIKLPKTARNQMVFNFLGVVGNMSTAPYSKLSCDYIVDGIPLIINGYTEVKSTKDSYEVVIYDGVIDLAEKLKEKTLADLNYVDLNHFLSVQNYIDSLDNTSGYIYALGKFINDRSSSTRIERQVPSVFTHTLWDKIFSQLGINYFGNFFTHNPDFKTEVVTPPVGYEVENISQTETFINSYSTTISSEFEISQDIIIHEEILDFNTTFISSDITFGSDGQLIINNDINLKVDLDISYNNSAESNLNLRVKLNGGTVQSTYLEAGSTTKTLSLNLTLNAGDVLQFTVFASDTYLEDNGFDRYRIDYSTNADISFTKLTGGFLIDFSKMMGDLPLIDFIKDVMQRYGLVIKPIKGTGDYEFIQFENLLNDREGAEDWSDKLVDVQGEQYGIKYAKENRATYEYHDDIQVPTHDGVLQIDNENAEPIKNLFKSPFQIPTTNKNFKGEPLYLHPVWEEKEEDGQTFIEVKDAPIKTFRIKKVNSNMTVYYFNDSNGTNYSGDLPFLSLENMSMQYFLNVYYKAYRFAVNRYKEVDATFNLNLMDVHYLDLFKLKYLKQTGKYYYLNEVKHNAGGKVSDTKLIEINQFSYNLPVQTLGEYTRNASFGTSGDVRLSYLTTQTTPQYYDPENDSPYAVKFISGFNSQVKLYQNGAEITDGTEILASEWNVTFSDLESTTNAHEHVFEFMIADEGSKSYGNQVGTFTVSVYAYQNQAPVADAGNDDTLLIDSQSTQTTYFIGVSGGGSTDNTGNITSYSWTILSKPPSSGATLNFTNNINASLEVPNEFESRGTYRLELTVTDEFGLTGTDTVDITVDEEFKQV